MEKVNNNSISLGLKILSILAFSLLLVPTATFAASFGTGRAYSTGSYEVEQKNPVPGIDSISPRSSNLGFGTKTITVTGGGFVPGSVGRVNGINRSTTFIDDSHLLVRVTGDDMYAYSGNGGFFITVFNPAPGGGYSNATFFTVQNSPASGQTNGQSGYEPASPDNFTETNNNNPQTRDSYGSLASGVIYGSDSFLPSGLIQWVLLAIIVILIVIMVRRLFGPKDEYDESPMKHA